MTRLWQRNALRAMRADRIPEGSAGRWTVSRVSTSLGRSTPNGGWIAPGAYTALYCDSMGARRCVMVDHEPELRTHLEAVQHARGRVLIGGMGLGCVLRGVLTRPSVREVVVVEREESVIDLVAPYLPDDDRVRIVQADIRETSLRASDFDVVWLDLWEDGERDERSVHLCHSESLRQILRGGHDGWVGCWAFPRHQRRLWGDLLSGSARSARGLESRKGPAILEPEYASDA